MEFALDPNIPWQEQLSEYERVLVGKRVRVPKGVLIRCSHAAAPSRHDFAHPGGWFPTRGSAIVVVDHVLAEFEGVTVRWAGRWTNGSACWKECGAGDVELQEFTSAGFLTKLQVSTRLRPSAFAAAA